VTFSATSPDGSRSRGRSAATIARGQTSVRSSRQGPFRERIIAPAGTEDLMIIRFTGPGTFTLDRLRAPAREFTIDEDTLQDASPTGPTPTSKQCSRQRMVGTLLPRDDPCRPRACKQSVLRDACGESPWRVAQT
jgi:hypothetical protein